jgi:hypothetical protein
LCGAPNTFLGCWTAFTPVACIRPSCGPRTRRLVSGHQKTLADQPFMANRCYTREGPFTSYEATPFRTHPPQPTNQPTSESNFRGCTSADAYGSGTGGYDGLAQDHVCSCM